MMGRVSDVGLEPSLTKKPLISVNVGNESSRNEPSLTTKKSLTSATKVATAQEHPRGGGGGKKGSSELVHEIDMTTHLLFLASKGDVSGIDDFLKKGADVNATDYDLRSALHLAASENRLDAVKFLLDHGAKVNALDRWNDTPLANALHYGYTDVCEVLAEHGGVAETSSRFSPGSVPEYEIDPVELDVQNGMPIGKGAFGEIRLVNWRGTRVAVKTILADLASNVNVMNEFRDELVLLQKLRHPNIVQFLGAVTQSTPLMLVTEYLPKGDLHDIMRKKGQLDAGTAVRFAMDIARGMAYLHQHRPHAIVHRDLKPRNLLQDEAGHLKVADFGLSKLLKAKNDNVHEVYQMTGETGSYRYMAPEVFRHEAYDKSVDVFSFAMITQEMFEGAPAYKYQLPGDIARDIAFDDLRPPFKVKSYPPGMKELLSDCWHKDPQRRPSFVEILEKLEKMEPGLPRRHSDPPKCQCSIM